jgi:hypothetical protein
MKFCLKPDYRYTVEMEFRPGWQASRESKYAALFTLGRTMNDGRPNSLSMMFWGSGADLFTRLNPEDSGGGAQIRFPCRAMAAGKWLRVRADYSGAQLEARMNGELMGRERPSGTFIWRPDIPFFVGTEDTAYNPIDGAVRNFRLTVSRPRIVFELSFPSEESIYTGKGPSAVNAVFPRRDGGELSLSVRVTDVRGSLVFEGAEANPPSEYASLPLPALKNGFYRAEVTARRKQGLAELVKTQSFAVLPEPYPAGFEPDSAFGIQHFYQMRPDGEVRRFRPEDIRRDARVMSWAGAKWFRLAVRWDDIENSPGKYEWDRLDACVGILREHGLSIMTDLCGTPRWASSEPPGKSREWNSWRTWAPKDFSRWGAFAGAVAARYKNEITYHQIWNEPDTPSYFLPFPRPDLYAELVRSACGGIKAASPEAKIVLGGFAGLPVEKTTANAFSARDFYSFKPNAFYDVFDFHCYSVWAPGQRWDSTPSRVIKPLRDFLASEGEGGKPFWNSETAFCSGVPGVKNNEFAVPNISHAEQARRVQQLYTLSAACGIGKTFWFLTRNDMMGLLERDGSPKPSYVAYATTAREFRGFKFLRDQSPGGPLKIIVLGDGRGSEKAVIWASEGKLTLTLKTSLDSVELRDLMGNQSRLAVSGGARAPA